MLLRLQLLCHFWAHMFLSKFMLYELMDLAWLSAWRTLSLLYSDSIELSSLSGHHDVHSRRGTQGIDTPMGAFEDSASNLLSSLYALIDSRIL